MPSHGTRKVLDDVDECPLPSSLDKSLMMLTNALYPLPLPSPLDRDPEMTAARYSPKSICVTVSTPPQAQQKVMDT